MDGLGPEIWGFEQSGEHQATQLWPGYNTEAIAAGDIRGNVQWRLRGVSGPGDVVLWQEQAYGDGTIRPDSVMFDSRRSFPQTFEIGHGVHGHMGWSFTAPGVYCLNLEMRARLPSGAATGDGGQLTVVVGDQDPEAVLPCGRTGVPAPVGAQLPADERRDGGPYVLDAESWGQLAPLVDGDWFKVELATRGRGQFAPVYRDVDDAVFTSTRALDPAPDDPGWHGEPGTRRWELLNHWTGDTTLLGSDLTRVADDAVQGDVRLTLGTVQGPGDLIAYDGWKNPAEGPTLSTRAASGLGSEAQLRPGENVRALDWSFSAPGVYCVPLTWTATLSSGRTVSATHTLTFALGSGVDPATVTPCARRTEEPAPPPQPPHASELVGSTSLSGHSTPASLMRLNPVMVTVRTCPASGQHACVIGGTP